MRFGCVGHGDSEETPCDVVILATGYKLTFPFISQDLISTTNNKVELFKYVFSPALTHPKTLAFISLIQPIGPIVPIGELQSRWFAQLMAGKRSLPSRQEMRADIAVKRQAMKRYYESERHTIQVDWLNFMDELAQQVGVKPNITKYFFTDKELWRALMFGPALPYQYRLEGPHSWSGAREALLSAEERIDSPLATKQPVVRDSRDKYKICLLYT
ncbi:unnamed protein product [Medioppia subpectinata]|uniref:Flavin-containing monooxygenase n=1 Tax=Medioppia subpectinata TaxID=1979941 RepID=A0A7R9Q0L0_9ACAR|nr:unnamed protein product [Medioppia subpectinata]CAG2107437.1 unnamed protein product [Medioppia subpectinata]